ncbi:hypothetical protein BX666DRAFT_1893023 [Dichotomocladium elegans]|nr:hypothetical protein BX666DRAFT_1893023 [Dichotomocladium elegans]
MDVESMTTTITTTRDQHQQQRIKELKSQYAAAVRRAEHAEQQHAQWARHVQEILSAQLSEKEAEARKARQLAELVVYQEQMIAAMQRDLERRDDIQELQRTREAVNQLWVAIDTLTGTKKGIQHAMHKVQHEQDASRHVLVQMQDALREVAAEVEVQRTQIAEKIEAMRRQLEEKEQEGHHHHHRSCGCSCRHHHHHDDDRMSIMSTGRAPRTARYTGGPLPPAAPPPTDPLPPLPVSSSSIPDNAPPSVYSSSSIITHDNASSVLFDDHHSERAYREFAEQLQTRLSVSKEIDDLHLWQSEDLEEFERRMHEKFKDIDVDKRQSFIHSLRSKEGATFWRGMKKKLRV